MSNFQCGFYALRWNLNGTLHETITFKVHSMDELKAAFRRAWQLNTPDMSYKFLTTEKRSCWTTRCMAMRADNEGWMTLT